MSHLLAPSGFDFVGSDKEASCLTWGRPFIDGCQLQITLWPRIEPNDMLSVGATLSIVSERQVEVERTLGLDQGNEPISIFSASVGWLALKFGIASSLSDIAMILSKIPRLSLESKSDDIARLLSRVAAHFVSAFPTPLDFSRLLVSLDAFSSGNMRGGAPVSSDAIAFAAVIAADAGEIEWALTNLRNRPPDLATETELALLKFLQ